MEDCIFCKIVKGEIPCYKIYENDYVLAFLDIAKDIDGHILVIPKSHCKSVLDCGENDLKEIMLAIQKISNHLINNCGYDGVNLINCCNEGAGKTVVHFHMHLIPRKKSDGEKVFPSFSGAKIELAEMCEKLKLKF